MVLPYLHGTSYLKLFLSVKLLLSQCDVLLASCIFPLLADKTEFYVYHYFEVHMKQTEILRANVTRGTKEMIFVLLMNPRR